MDPATGKSKWLYLNARAAAFYDVPEEQLWADPDVIKGIIVPEDLPELETAIQEGIRSGAPMVYCCRMRRRDGELRWIESHATVEKDDEGFVLWYGQALDITDRKRFELAALEAEKARARAESLYRQIIDALPIGVMVVNQQIETLHMNPTHSRFIGGITQHTKDDAANAYGIFELDGVTPLPMESSGMVRGLRGEDVEEEVIVRNSRISGDKRMQAAWSPLRDEAGNVFAAVGCMLDVTVQRALEAELRTRNEQLAAGEEAKSQLIDRLRYSIDELSNPVLEVWEGVLAMPIIGVVDSRRTADMVQRLLGEVARTQASFVIVDLTGVDIVDTKTADHLMKLMRKVEIIGARCVLTGIRPAVAETLVDIGVDFGDLGTLRNLKHGLREALRLARRDGSRGSELEDDMAEDAQQKRRAN
ncbi:RsbR, positive regulator of sigma-B [Minicystis rosea]|nr:RsbR, positive regulator of sigma-B [Minicystis rosea]